MSDPTNDPTGDKAAEATSTKVKMKAPEGVETFSIGGILREIKDGFATIEAHLVDEAKAHGFLLHDDAGKDHPAEGEAEKKEPATPPPATPAPAADASTGATTSAVAASGPSSADTTKTT